MFDVSGQKYLRNENSCVVPSLGTGDGLSLWEDEPIRQDFSAMLPNG